MGHILHDSVKKPDCKIIELKGFSSKSGANYFIKRYFCGSPKYV